MPVPKENVNHMRGFDMETASAEELMDEIIRITVFEYKALCAKIANPHRTQYDREMIEYLVARYAVNSNLVDSYLFKLQETMKDLPPGGLHAAIKQRELHIMRQFQNAHSN